MKWNTSYVGTDGTTPVIGSDGTVYVQGTFLYAFDGGSGTLKFQVRRAPNDASGSMGLSIGPDGALYTTTAYILSAVR